MTPIHRRDFLHFAGTGAAALGLGARAGFAEEKPIAGFEQEVVDEMSSAGWKPVSNRKIRMGIAGFGVCQFGGKFYFQNHPNVTVAAVTDLDPGKCAALAALCKCPKTYPSCEEMIQDDTLEAVFIATDAPSHARLAIAALKAGKHVASAVPAVFGSLEDADELFAAVKATGRKYMMFETSYFHEDLYTMRQFHQAGQLGKVMYAEGEYWHYMEKPIASYKGWRDGLIPQWYPTHSNAYYVGVTGGSFTEVSCLGTPSLLKDFQPGNNRYQNPFGTEVAFFRTSEGGMARMAVGWDSPGMGGESGRLRTQKGSFNSFFQVEGGQREPLIKRPPLPPGVNPGLHGGSHGYLTSDFIESILADRKPLVDVAQALNMTVAGIVAHQSALKDGERMKIPQFKL